MASGLVALLDDIAGIAKLAAASLDDVTAAAGKAGVKAAGVVVDDTAVTPNYVTGFTPDRELPIIWRIAMGSIRNKLLFLLPGALLLSAFAPWAVTPLLMLGGTYLCFEATEKLIEAIGGHDHADDEVDPNADPAALEAAKISGAIRTDFILSAEIMAIALADVADRPIFVQAVALAIVGIAITVAVYGVVALIVKMDDIGLHLAKRDAAATRTLGRGLVKGMPVVMSALSAIGTAAMLWVGGGIVVHGLEHFHLTPIPGWIEHAAAGAAAALPAVGGAAHWLVFAIGSAIVGGIVGGVVMLVVHAIKRARHPAGKGEA
jgi:predicted DNA repair protein MutK